VDDKIKFGIIGTGRMAITMLRAMREISEIDVIAVGSGSIDRAREFAHRFGINASYGNLEEFLRNDAISAVYIANRNIEHCASAIAALSAGKAVLCEKPFAINMKEGQEVLLAARSSRRLFMEAMWTPLLPAYMRLRQLVQSGSFGRPTHLHFNFGYPTSAQSNPMLFTATGGGVLLDRSGYGIALALAILGDVQAVDATLSLNGDGVDIGAALQLAHRTGGQSQLGFSLNSLMSNAATVACEGGMVGLMPPTIGAEIVFYQHMSAILPTRSAINGIGMKQRIIRSLRRNSFMRRAKNAVSGPKTEYHTFGVNPYAPTVRHFIKLLRTEQLESNVITMDSSLAALRIIEAAKDMRLNRDQCL
jgi:predicted dehydrogenase